MRRNKQGQVKVIKTSYSRASHAKQVDAREKKSLFSPAILDDGLRTYDFVEPGYREVDAILSEQNPGLLAMKKKKGYSAPASRANARPVGGSDEMSKMTSLLNKQPLAPLRVPEQQISQVIEKRVEEEKMAILFKDDPIAYFSKRKDGRGHRFIYLNLLRDKNDPDFSIYQLTKVVSSELDDEHFTMSASGVTHVKRDGTTDHLTLDEWTKEVWTYDSIRKLKIFKFYRWWKPVKLWRLFIVRQRYMQVERRLRQSVVYGNNVFAETMKELVSDSIDDMIREHLLAFPSQRKFRMDEFQQWVEVSHTMLTEKFEMLMESIINVLVKLQHDIGDQDRITVGDTDFPEIRRRNPNLGQLVVLEQRKEYETERRIDIVHRETQAFGQFIRMMDYVVLETLLKASRDAWFMAYESVRQDMASIFELQISFSQQGEIVFSPSIDELRYAINDTLTRSTDVVDKLPRVLKATRVRPILRETIPYLTEVFESGPSFLTFAETNIEYEQVREAVIQVIEKAYRDSLDGAHVFLEFFPIYRTGMEWNPERYVHSRGGEGKPIDLTWSNEGASESVDPIIFDTSKEDVIDVHMVDEDIVTFKAYENMMRRFRPCTVKGALYVDSRKLRSILQEIPGNCMKGVRDTLMRVVAAKIERVSNICEYSRKRLKRDPTVLEKYVDFCDFLDRAVILEPLIRKEVIFVDEIYQVFHDNNFTMDGPAKNPTPNLVAELAADIQAALSTKRRSEIQFNASLKRHVKRMKRKIKRYHAEFTDFPKGMKEMDIDNAYLRVKVRHEKIAAKESTVQQLLYFQNIMKLETCNFANYSGVKDEGQYMVALYETVQSWNRIEMDMTKIPMTSVRMSEFVAEVDRIHNVVSDMRSNGHNNTLVDDLELRVNRVYPHIKELALLADGKMQLHHWTTLFKDCGRAQSYYPQVKIEEIVSFGILDHKKEIAEMTETSQGESQVETEFQAIQNRWENMELPVDVEEDGSIVLKSLTSIFNELVNTQIVLEKMLHIPYVRMIRESIVGLAHKLEDVAQILDVWALFQVRWLRIGRIAGRSDVKKIVNTVASRFTKVKRRWASISSHAVKDKKLLQVCSFPGLKEILNECSESLVAVRKAMTPYLSAKRTDFPRMFFISDDDLLKLLSTADFTDASRIAAKMFMDVDNFDYFAREEDNVGVDSESEQQGSFESVTITGLRGKDGDVFTFGRPVSCIGNYPQWLQTVVEEMQQSVKNLLTASLGRFITVSIGEWATSVPAYIGILTLQVIFWQEIEDCFSYVETNTNIFATYEQKLRLRLTEFRSAMVNPSDPGLWKRLSRLASLVIWQISQVKTLLVGASVQSKRVIWEGHVRFAYNLPRQEFMVLIDKSEAIYGYEYFGNVKQVLFSPAGDRAIEMVCRGVVSGQHPLVLGTSGQRMIMDWVAALHGKFIYFPPSFVYSPDRILDKIVQGVVATNSWVMFKDIDDLSHRKLCFIYDHLRYWEATRSKILDCGKGYRLFFSGSSKFFDNTEVPAQLRTALKPIALASPDARLLTFAKLSSLGFTSLKTLPGKMIAAVTTIVHTFSDLAESSIIGHIFGSIEVARVIVQVMMYSNDVKFINYYEGSGRTEEYAIARSLFLRFSPCMDSSDWDGLLLILSSTFEVFPDVDLFMKCVRSPECFPIDEAHRHVTSAVNELPECHVPREYLVEKCISLYSLMQQHPIVVVTGLSRSGKTTVVNTMGRVFTELAKNPALINKFPMVRPTKIVDLFTESGEIFDTDTTQGKLEQAVMEFRTSSDTDHRILRFSGKADRAFFSRIESFMNHEGFYFDSFNEIPFNPQFHILIETDTMAEFSPGMLSRCGIMSIQRQPIASPELGNGVSADSYEDVISAFRQFVGVQCPELWDLCVIMEHHGLSLYRQYMTQYQVHESKALICLVHSIFMVYSGIMTESLAVALEKELCNNFSIPLDIPWDAVGVTPHAKEAYSSPTMRAAYLTGNETVAMNFEKLKESPVMRGNPRTMSQQFISDYAIRNAYFIPRLFTASLAFEGGSYLFVSGDDCGGKASLLFYIMKECRIADPIIVPSGPASTTMSIAKFIQQHSQLCAKEYMLLDRSVPIVLIFEDVAPSSAAVCEVIKMIVEHGQLSILEDEDAGIEILKMRNIKIIVTSKYRYSDFPARIVAPFVPIVLPEMNETAQCDVVALLGQRLYVQDADAMNAYRLCQSAKCSFWRCLDLLPYMKAEEENVKKLLNFEATFFSSKRRLEGEEIAFPVVKLLKDDHVLEVSLTECTAAAARDEMQQILTKYNETERDAIRVNCTSPMWYNFICVKRCICYPCGNVCIRGDEGTGRYSMSRLAAFSEEFEWYEISELSELVPIIEMFVMSRNQFVVFTKVASPELVHFAKTKEFGDFFCPESLRVLYQKVAKVEEVDAKVAVSARTKMLDMLMIRMHVIIAADRDFPMSETQFCYNLEFDCSFDDTYEVIAAETLSVNPDIPGECAGVVASVHRAFGNSDCQFFDFLELVLLRTDQNTRQVHNMRQNGVLAHEFLERLHTEKDKDQNVVNETAKKIQDMDERNEGRADDLDERKSEVDARVAVYDDFMHAQDEKEAVLLNTIDGLEEQIQNTGAVMNQVSAKMLRVDEKEIQTLQVFAQEPPPKLNILLCVIAGYLGLPMDYETGGKIVLMDENFVRTITTSISGDMSATILHAVDPVFTGAELELRDFDCISPLAVMVYRWINAVHRHAMRNLAVKKARQEIEDIKKETEDYVKEHAEERAKDMEDKGKIDMECEELAGIDGVREALVLKKEEYERKVASVESMIGSDSNCASIIEEEMKELEAFAKVSVVRALMTAAYIVYCGTMDVAMRQQVVKSISDQFTGFEEEDPLTDVILGIASNEPPESGFPANIIVDGQHVCSLIRTPMIEDPDGLARKYIARCMSNIIECSALCDSFERTAAQAVCNGSTLIVYDGQYANPTLLQVLRSYNNRNATKRERRMLVGTTEVAMHPKFRLFLMGNGGLGSKVALVKASILSLTSVEATIAHAYMPSSYHNALRITMATEADTEVEIRSSARVIVSDLATLNGMGENWFEDAKIVTRIVTFVDNVYRLRKRGPEIAARTAEIAPIFDKIRDNVEKSQCIWEAISRYFSVSPVFKFHVFIGIIDKAMVADRNPLVDLIQYVLVSIPLNWAIACLTVAAYLFKRRAGSADDGDLDVVVNQFVSAGKGPGHDIMDSIFARLKKSSFPSLFSMSMKVVTSTFGEIIQPPFSLDCLGRSGVTVVLTSRDNDVTAVLVHALQTRSRGDPVNMVCITRQMNAEAMKVAHEAMAGGLYLVLIYEDPSMETANTLSTLMSGLRSSSRVLIVLNSLNFVPQQIFDHATIYNFEWFPGIRNQMMHMYKHLQPILESIGNPTKSKKTGFVCALLFSVLNFRTMFGMNGFSEFPRLNEIQMREVFAFVRRVVDAGDNFPWKNVRDYLADFVFGCACIDTFDRRKIRAHVYTIFSGDLETSYFVQPRSQEAEIWKFPSAGYAINAQLFERYPQFSSTQVLYMDPAVSDFATDWAMSDWLSVPMKELYSKTVSAVKSLRTSVPDYVVVPEQCRTPLEFYTRTEIIIFNQTIDLMSRSVHLGDPEGPPPAEWQELVGFGGYQTVARFVEYMSEKRRFLADFILSKTQARVEYLSDVQGLLQAYLHEQALTAGTPVDTMELAFSFTGSGDGLKVTGLHIAGGYFAGELCEPSDNGCHFRGMPTMIVSAKKRATRLAGTYMCPLFNALCYKRLNLRRDMERVDGEVRNFVWYVPVPCKVGDRYLVSNNTCLVCKIPDVFRPFMNS